MLLGFEPGELADLIGGKDVDDLILDPTDGHGQTPAPPVLRLKWGKQEASITQDECDALSAAFERFAQESGVSFGFVRALINGDLRA
jgi:hypothetical protein